MDKQQCSGNDATIHALFDHTIQALAMNDALCLGNILQLTGAIETSEIERDRAISQRNLLAAVLAATRLNLRLLRRVCVQLPGSGAEYQARRS